MEAALWFAIGAFVFGAFVVVHEVGHAVAARLIGVPADDVAIRLFEWPAHVALRSNGQWHVPGTLEYQDAYERHDPQLRWLGLFIAAGFVVQTITMGLAVGASLVLGFDDFGARLVRISIVVNALYLVGDAVVSLVAREPAGDMSSMLRHTRAEGLATLALLVAAHATARHATALGF